MLISSFNIDCRELLLPPVLVIMEDVALAFLTVAFLKERNLIAEAELNEFADVKMSLGAGLEIEIVPDTISKAETDIMAGLLSAGTVRSRI